MMNRPAMLDLKMTEFISKSRIPKNVVLLLTSILPFLLHYLDNHYDSSLPFKLFTYSSERNYMFLFCNGILVLIIANSSADRNSEMGSDPIVERIKKRDNFERSEIAVGSDPIAEQIKRNDNFGRLETVVKFEMEKTGEEDYYIDKYPIVEEEVKVEMEDGNGLLNEEEIPNCTQLYTMKKKYPIVEEETEEVEYGIVLLNEEEVDDNKQNGKDEIELLSVDELNRRFEDFIRKMRKEIDNGGT